MPFVTTTAGALAFGLAMTLFLVQEFTQGFATPDGVSVRDDRAALLYLEALPIVLVSVASWFSYRGWTAWSQSRTIFIIGLVILITGLAIRQWSHQALGRFHQAIVTIHEQHELITEGPYRFVRHPMYAGSAVAFLGVGLALGTWTGLLLAFLGTLPAILRRIHVEEQALEHSLGARYRSYARGRPRMIPGVW